MRALFILIATLTAIGLVLLIWPSQDSVPSSEPFAPSQNVEETRERVGPPRRAAIDTGTPATELVPEPSPAAFRLEGRVVDAFGHGIENCSVLVEDHPQMVTLHETERKALGQTRSDNFGYFQLEFRDSEKTRLGPLLVSLDAIRYPPTVARTHVEIRRGKVTDLGPLVLSSERGINARCESTTGAPIADARLTLAPVLDDPLLSTGALARTRRAAISDRDGYAQFYGVPAGVYRIRAEAATYATHELTHHQVTASTASPIRIILKPGTVQRGRVLSAEGRAVAGASVFAEPSEGGPQTKTQSDSEGYFRLTGLIAGSYALEVQSQAFGELRKPKIDLPRAELLLRLPSGAKLAGRISDAKGNPQPGAHIEAKSATGWTIIRNGAKVTFTAITDDEGLFLISNMPAGRFELSVSSQGQAASLHGPFDAGDTEIQITLATAIVIQGKVVDEHGNGISGRLEVMNLNYDGSAFAEFTRLAVGGGTASARTRRHREIETTVEGFELSVSAGGFRLLFRPQDPRYAKFVSRPIQARTDRVSPFLSLRAPAASQIQGVAHQGLKDSPGAAGVTVHLEPVGDAEDGQRRIAQRTLSDANGGFSFSGVASGQYELFFDTRDRQSAADAAASRSRTLESITLDAGASGQRTTLHLEYQR